MIGAVVASSTRIRKRPSEDTSYGGIAAFHSGLIFVDGNGLVWFFENGRFTKVESEEIANGKGAYLKRISNIKARSPQSFAVKDIEIINTPQPYIYASATEYELSGDCLVLSLFRTPITKPSDGPVTVGAWTKIFSTEPCLRIDMNSWKVDAEGQFPELRHSGGRIIKYSETEILLSVGDFHGNGVNGPEIVQNTETHYGKIIKLDVDTFTPEIFSTGHRNPQGLVMTQSGRIFSTEHGPQGGDELNLILAGRNYGWPLVTFGTNYNETSWPLNDGLRDHSGYEKPIYSWVPSVAVSNIVEVVSSDLLYWGGDLLVSSLKEETIYRVKLNGVSPIVIEPIYIGSRIRDIVNFNGGFALQTDVENQLMLIKRTVHNKSN